MNYLKKRFTVPVQVDISQEEWNHIFAEKEDCPRCGHSNLVNPGGGYQCGHCGYLRTAKKS